MEIGKIKEQIKYNCDVSDARYWGYYSMCGMLMRMRELYRQEKSLLPWQSIATDDLSEWITSREALWGKLEEENFRDIEIEGNQYNPFDVERINDLLNLHGFVYGSGYGMFHKPTFFFSRLKSKMISHGYLICHSEEELCRDLSSSMAMLQGKNIIIRLEPLKAFLYEKFLEMKGRRFQGALHHAFSYYGIERTDELSESLHRRIEAASSDVAKILIMHELGEAFEDDQIDRWLDLLNHCTNKISELSIRGINDLLADTTEMGPLTFIVKNKDRVLLSFYMILLDGIRKNLFPEMMDAFQSFIDNSDWSSIEKAKDAGYSKAKKIKEDVLHLWNKRGRIEEIEGFIKTII